MTFNVYFQLLRVFSMPSGGVALYNIYGYITLPRH